MSKEVLALPVTKLSDFEGVSFFLHRVYVRLLPLSVLKAMAFVQAPEASVCGVCVFPILS